MQGLMNISDKEESTDERGQLNMKQIYVPARVGKNGIVPDSMCPVRGTPSFAAHAALTSASDTVASLLPSYNFDRKEKVEPL